MVILELRVNLVLWAVVFPQVSIAAVGKEGLGGRRGALVRRSGGRFVLGRRWRFRGWRGVVLERRFFGEEVTEAGVEITEWVAIVGGFAAPWPPAHGGRIGSQ